MFGRGRIKTQGNYIRQCMMASKGLRPSSCQMAPKTTDMATITNRINPTMIEWAGLRRWRAVETSFTPEGSCHNGTRRRGTCAGVFRGAPLRIPVFSIRFTFRRDGDMPVDSRLPLLVGTTFRNNDTPQCGHACICGDTGP